MKENTILFTGTFDPFHLGHIWQLNRTYEICKFNRVVIAVIKNNTKKPNALSSQHRINLIKAYLSDANLAYEVDIRIIDKNGPKEIRKFLKTLPYKISTRTVGSDSVLSIINTPSEIEELSFLKYFIGIRDKWSLNELNSAIKVLPSHIFEDFNYELLPIRSNGLMATEIRKNTLFSLLEGYLTTNQYKYILDNKLYDIDAQPIPDKDKFKISDLNKYLHKRKNIA